MLQQFDLPANEHLLAVEKKSFPFYWHEKCEENLRQKYNQDMKLGLASSGSWQPSLTMSHDIQLTNHTVLDGCIIVTDASVYEMKPRCLFVFFLFGVCIGFHFRKLTFHIKVQNIAIKL